MIIIGVDPGTWRTGIGVIEASGNHYKLLASQVVAIRESLPLAQRLNKIYNAVCEVIAAYHPDKLALENVFYRRNVRSMLHIGEARACAMLAASNYGVDVVEYPPAVVKQSVSGNGRASKEQVQAMIKTLLNLKAAPPNDAADALAVAVCHLHHFKHDFRRQLIAQGAKTRVRIPQGTTR